MKKCSLNCILQHEGYCINIPASKCCKSTRDEDLVELDGESWIN